MKKCAWFLGAHKGEDMVQLLEFFDCYALEANPNLESQLVEIVAPSNILMRALTPPGIKTNQSQDKALRTTFYSSKNRTTWGTLETSRLLSGSEHTEFDEFQVETVELREIERLWPKPSLIIADLEGSEYRAVVGPMLQRMEYYKNTIFVVEVSKDNWKEIYFDLEKFYDNFTVVINAEIDETGPTSDGMVPEYDGHRRTTSSIGKYMARTLLQSGARGSFSPDPFNTLDSWFKSKNTDLRFNFSAWVDLVAWPSLTDL